MPSAGYDGFCGASRLEVEPPFTIVFTLDSLVAQFLFESLRFFLDSRSYSLAFLFSPDSIVDLLPREKYENTLLIKDSGVWLPVNNVPKVGRQAQMIEVHGSMELHINMFAI